MLNETILTPEQEEIDQESYDAIAERVKNFDFARVTTLLDVIQKCAGIGPKNNAIIGLAQAELDEFADEAKQIALARADAKAKAEAEHAAAAQAEREAQEAADAETVDADDDGIPDDEDPDVRPRAIPSTGRRV